MHELLFGGRRRCRATTCEPRSVVRLELGDASAHEDVQIHNKWSRACSFIHNTPTRKRSHAHVHSQSVSQFSRTRPALTHPPAHSPAPPLPVEHKYRVLASGGYSIRQLSQVRSISPSVQGVPCRFLPCTVRAGFTFTTNRHLGRTTTGPVETNRGHQAHDHRCIDSRWM